MMQVDDNTMECIRREVKRAAKEAEASFADKVKSAQARMECLNFAAQIASESILREPTKLLDLADTISAYVLTGKKPGEA